MIIKPLDWDTEFLGIKVGRFDIKETEWSGIVDALASAKDEGYQLIYAYLDELKAATLGGLQNYRHYIDIRATYQKAMDKSGILDISLVKPYEGQQDWKTVLHEIALQTGHSSRYKMDLNMPEGTYERLYKIWIDNATERSIVDEFLVAERDGQILGLLTLKFKEQTLVIDLIGVHSSARGQGVGKLLVAAAEERFADQFDRFTVLTQESNTGACRFYEKLGFSLLRRDAIAHVWL